VKLLVPPPLVFLLVIIATYLSKLLVPATQINIPLMPNVGLAVAALGVLLALIAFASFLAKRTTVSPHHPEKSSALVTDGVYAFSRNPMYLSLALIAGGTALMQAAPLGLVFTVAAAWYITRFQIVPEEEMLAEKFGDDYANYRAKVRRWV